MMSPAVRPNLASTPAKRLDQILADEVDFRAGLRLRIGHHHDVERLRLILAAQREIDRRRQRPGRRQALEAQVELGRRALGLMVAVEARQIGERLDRRHEARRLDDEDRRLVRQRQRVAAVGPGDGDVAAVRDEDAGEPRIGCARQRPNRRGPRTRCRTPEPLGASCASAPEASTAASARPPAAPISTSRRVTPLPYAQTFLNPPIRLAQEMAEA